MFRGIKHSYPQMILWYSLKDVKSYKIKISIITVHPSLFLSHRRIFTSLIWAGEKKILNIKWLIFNQLWCTSLLVLLANKSRVLKPFCYLMKCYLLKKSLILIQVIIVITTDYIIFSTFILPVCKVHVTMCFS